MLSEEEKRIKYLILLKFAEVDLSNLISNPKTETKKIRKLPQQDPEVLKKLLQKLGDPSSGECRASIKLWVNEVDAFCNTPEALEFLSKYIVLADFSVDLTTPELGKPVRFKNNSKNAKSFVWDFGDGETKKVKSTSEINHKFKKSGEFTVTLTAENEYSHNSKSLPIFVQPPAKPKAVFSVPVRTIYVRSEALFDDQSTYAETTTWEYGDGTSGSEPRHTYDKPGIYTVTLTVTNAAGEDSTSKTLIIHIPEKVPIAQLRCYTEPKRRIAGYRLMFHDASTNSPLDWEWDFGDGMKASGSEVEHTYAKEGKYTVTLTASNETGKCEHPAKEVITILPPPPKPKSKFEVKKIEGKTITFRNLSSQGPYHKYEWDFGDGKSSQDANPTHKYAIAGTYTVTLTVKSERSEDVFSLPLEVSPSPKPKAGFKVVSRKKMDNAYYVTFLSTSKHAIEWEWDFGDGYSDTDENPPSHAYFKKGKVHVTLTVTNDDGDSDTCTKIIHVEDQRGAICCGGALAIAIVVIAGIVMMGNLFDFSLSNQFSPVPTSTQSISISEPTGTSSPTSELGISLPYSETYSFSPGSTSVTTLDLVDVEPVIYITTSYTVKEITDIKGYTDTNTKQWVEKKVTRPDPNAAFEVIVTDENGEIVASEGYGGIYDSGSTDTIKLMSSGTYHIQMCGKSMDVRIDIR